ncbi:MULTISPECIES: hypothetical protein [Novosphingobium]|jgi:hypothetical protein|uniref:Uncharacterized protein n=2 Tax=Novosphingobium TaxID=165696 RepID=A0A2N0H458_9SPHN|nr:MULTISPECIES: hypothetical protein [Novosphingobium]MDF8335738.1 hypothetical protein [Novosphingobium cyanobacteriorum]PKB13718.1 hypothetical protein B0I00_3160 [Novosphingobium kunmingense]
MAKQGTNSRTGTNGQYVVVRTKGARGSKVKFGSVTISGNKPSAGLVKKNIERSTAALERVVKRLERPGVDIRAKKDVPQFSVADGEPGVFIRRLNGRINRGRLVNGAFEVID